MAFLLLAVDSPELTCESQAAGIPEFLVAITQPSPSPSFDVYSRVFAPRVGIAEDPVVSTQFHFCARRRAKARLAYPLPDPFFSSCRPEPHTR